MRAPSRGQWLRWATLVTLTALYFVSVMSGQYREEELRRSEAQRVLTIIAGSAQNQAEIFFGAIRQMLVSVRAELAHRPSDVMEQSVLEGHFLPIDYLAGLFVFDSHGTVTAGTFPSELGKNYAYRRFFNVHLSGDGPEIFSGDVLVGRATQAPHFSSSIAVRDAHRHLISVVSAVYHVSFLKNLLASIVPAEPYTVGLFHRELGLLVASDSEIQRGRLPFGSQLQGLEKTLATLGPEGPAYVALPGGKVAVRREIAAGPFEIVAVADMNRLMAPRQAAGRQQFALALVFLLTVIGLGASFEIYLAHRRRAEQEKRRLEGELRQAHKLEALGTFASGLAHDFNNLLNTILGQTELLLARASPGSSVSRGIEQIRLAGQRAEALVDQVLIFSGRGERDGEPTCFATIFEETLRQIRDTLPPRVRLDAHCDSALATAFTRLQAVHLHQILANLCENALHAFDTTGAICIDASQALLEPASTDESGSKAEPCVTLRVSDNGRGIEASDLERVFDPFFTTKQARQGTGLGLSIVHGLVSAAGGSLRIDSTPGLGTTISISLPIVPAPSVTEPELPALNSEGRSVVVLDDDAGALSVLEEHLSALGFEVTAFESALEAVDFVASWPNLVRAVLTDYRMPDLDGIEVAQRIAAINNEIPVILVTSLSTPTLAKKAMRAGCRTVLPKPVDRSALIRALAPICSSPLKAV